MSLTPGAMLPNGFTMTLIIPISDGGLIVCQNFMKVIWEKKLRDEISAIKRSKKCCLFWHYPLKGLFVATLFIESTNTWHYALCTKSIGTWYYSLLSMLNKIYIYIYHFINMLEHALIFVRSMVNGLVVVELMSRSKQFKPWCFSTLFD